MLASRPKSTKGSEPVKWNEESPSAFDKLKWLCTEVPLLTYASFKQPFILYTEFSANGLEVAL